MSSAPTRAMKRFFRSAACFVLVWTGLLRPAPLPAQQARDVVIRGGWLFPGTGEQAVANPGIRVRAGKFFEIGVAPEQADPAGAQVVKLSDDEYILPGMFDLHAHYAMDLFGEGRVEETTAYPVLFLANGVTSTFSAGEMDPERMRQLRIAIDRGERIGPRIFSSGPYFGAAAPGWDPEITPEEIHRRVDHWAERGVKGFKAKRIRSEHLRALIERAHQHGLTVTGHLGSGFDQSVNPRDAILMGIDRVEHFLGGDAFPADRSAYESLVRFAPGTPEFERIVALYLKHNVFFDPTLSAYGYFGEQDLVVFEDFADEQKYLTPYLREVLRQREPRRADAQFETIYRVKRGTLRGFYQAGGGDLITLGTDHPSWGQFLSGFSVHRELHSLVLAGVPPAAALRIATINGARALGVSDQLGSIEPRKWADLFIVRGDPLEDIRNTRNVRWVMKAGRLYDAPALLRSVEGKIGPAGPGEVPRWTPNAGSGRQ
jgi:imidazolonepropionase-like amidohydrolase